MARLSLIALFRRRAKIAWGRWAMPPARDPAVTGAPRTFLPWIAARRSSSRQMPWVRATGAIPAKGARYEDTCVDRRAAFGGLAGRSATTAGAWGRRPDKQFDPSKHRPYMY
jgi:hypothetical protein